MTLNPPAKLALIRSLRLRFSQSMPERILERLTDDDLLAQYEREAFRKFAINRQGSALKFVRAPYIPQK